MLISCNLGDLGFRGSKFTWRNYREDGGFVKEWLDRGVATPAWCSYFPDVVLEVLPVSCSDHNPLWLSLTPTTIDKPKLFRFEACWNVLDECAEVVKQAWITEEAENISLETMHQKLQRCQVMLQEWSRNSVGAVNIKLKKKQKQLEHLQKNEKPALEPKIQAIQGEINALLEMEDIRWRQRAKRNWYVQGDRNTQYFHAWANQRRKSNGIVAVTDQEGRKWTKRDDIGSAFAKYYQNLFSTEGVVGIDECLSSVSTRVSPAMNELLSGDFSPDEVNSALSQMQPLKSPGPDGFGVSFYQKHWHIIGDEVRHSVLNFLNLGMFNSVINATFIALIPKVASAANVTEYRPISLCNVLYKLIAKVLANRLKQVLPSIISIN